MEGAWAERASTLSDLLHTNPTGKTYGYFPASSSAVTQLFLLCHTQIIHTRNKRSMPYSSTLAVLQPLFEYTSNNVCQIISQSAIENA